MHNKRHGNIWRGRLSRYAPVLFWIGLIFFLSTGAGAMSETSRFVVPILRFFFPGASEETIRLLHLFVRKSAHFTEYAILAFFASRALLSSHLKFLQKNWHIVTLVLVLTVAGLDEFGQSVDPARTGSLIDVSIDLFGGLFAVAVVALYRAYISRSRIRQPNPA